MTRSIPRVHDGSLHVPIRDDTISVIALGSSAWEVWVEHARSFRFETPHASFTARKEQRPGGWYWYAYRRRHGTLHIAYLGKSEELSVERLHTVATVLAGAEGTSEETSHLPQQRSFDAPLHEHHLSNIPSPSALGEAGSLTEARQAGKHNLPIQLTSLVGREAAITTATALIRRPEVRLLSMIGTGGIGKTRLAIAVATELLEDFSDGISFVGLAPLRDPNMVLPTIAHTLGLKESESEPVADRLHTYLRDKQLLLVLDNFEHLMPAAHVIGELLTSSPRLTLLVTSREVLHLSAERQFSVPPLAVPDCKHVAHVQSLTQYPALDLFMQRAQAVKHEFHLHESNAQVLAEICSRLDGLPLAIELAAARIGMLSPQALLARLDHRLQVLTHGPSDLPERQQTLRQTIQWSYELLKPEEQRLFQRMSVFASGATLEAIEAVCEALGDEKGKVFDGVASLLDKSLLQQTEQEDEEPRFMMLETIREYGLEELATNGEMEAARHAHAAYFLELAEQAEPKLYGAGDEMWLEHLEREHDNLRIALRWLLERGQAEQGIEDGREMALRLAGALQWFWQVRGHLNEGRTFLEQALMGCKEVASPVWAKALFAAAQLAHFQGDDSQAETLLEESLTLYRELQDIAGVAFSLHFLGRVARTRGNLVAARSLYKEALALWKELGDKKQIAYSLEILAMLDNLQGKYTRAHALCEESLAIQRELGNKVGISDVLLQLAWNIFLSQGHLATVHSLIGESLVLSKEMGDKRGNADCCYLSGHIALSQDDAFTARALAEEGLLLYREVGVRKNIAQSLSLLGRTVALQYDYTAARALFEESLCIAREIGDKQNSTFYLEGLASVVAAQGEPVWAARLWGSAEALRESMGVPISPVERTTYERTVEDVRGQLNEKAFATAWDEGRSMTPEQALSEKGQTTVPILTSSGQTLSSPMKLSATYLDGLTAREVEVLRLVAQGLTDEQVAEQLVISRHTVNSHLKAIYGKLGISSRSAATHYALQQHLL
jgi:predicted ATPase/DNA-binding CsgD family transcriptional regulator/tetratricopeptide (TPR) repeat protein